MHIFQEHIEADISLRNALYAFENAELRAKNQKKQIKIKNKDKSKDKKSKATQSKSNQKTQHKIKRTGFYSSPFDIDLKQI